MPSSGYMSHTVSAPSLHGKTVRPSSQSSHDVNASVTVLNSRYLNWSQRPSQTLSCDSSLVTGAFLLHCNRFFHIDQSSIELLSVSLLSVGESL